MTLAWLASPLRMLWGLALVWLSGDWTLGCIGGVSFTVILLALGLLED